MTYAVTNFFGIDNPHHFVFLIVLGVLSALTGFGVDFVIQYILQCTLLLCLSTILDKIEFARDDSYPWM